jgi:sulfate adenylyltransferase
MRDTKGMYAKARREEIANFTGISDPYELPLHAEITLHTKDQTSEENAELILRYLIDKGFVRRMKQFIAASTD